MTLYVKKKKLDKDEYFKGMNKKRQKKKKEKKTS